VSATHLKGRGVSPGIAIGEPVIHEARPMSALRITIPVGRVDEEVERFRAAIQSTIVRICENRDRAAQQMGEEYAAIFEAHQLIASDSSLLDPVIEHIRSRRVNAEWALDQVVSALVEKFEGLPDAYLADRKADVLDVATQIAQTLKGLDLSQLSDLDRPVVLVADDLPPSTAVQLPLDRILGFALETGGPTSHTTIIARSFGIPVIVGVAGVCAAAEQCRMVAMDAFEGKIVIDPNPAELSEYEQRQREYQEQQAHLFHLRVMPTVTRDGHTIDLFANIDLPPEVDLALQWNVSGVGLYRSEFLYMKMSPGLPTEEDHLAEYRDLAQRMGDRPVTIRTFDLGGKKLARQVIGTQEVNPVLGLRGIRLCFDQPEFFRTQLRAIFRATGEFDPGRIRVMFPLISGIEEFQIARLLVRQVVEELRSEGHPVSAHVPLGAMIEVPSSAILAHELAREADFLSIGTNDLIQYTLAVDRSNERVADLYRPTSPAVLRLIAHVIAAGKAAGVEVSMCGEMAADPLMVPVLVGMGLRNLSMNPQNLPVVRSLVRQLSFRETESMARSVRSMVTAREVEEYLLERLAIVLAKSKIWI